MAGWGDPSRYGSEGHVRLREKDNTEAVDDGTGVAANVDASVLRCFQ